MARWYFAPLSKGAVRRDPSEQVLFKSEDSSDEYAGTDQLVREIIQNSLDAVYDPNQPVRVRLALFENNEKITNERLRYYFSGLETALTAKYSEIQFSDGIPNLSEGFMVCEDFNTRGLEGDTKLESDPEPNSIERQDFYWFWRNIGRSGKTGDDLGRWGLGKTVYRAASCVGCMFGLTNRQSDKKSYLMGQAVLVTHKQGETECLPEGFWGEIQDDFPLPVDQQSEIDQFCEDWHLKRKDEPGLSVVVPFVHSELKAEKLAQAVAVNFLVPILQNQLIVEIESADFNLQFTADSLLSECKNKITWTGNRRNKRDQAPPVEFVRECLNNRDPVIISNLLGNSGIKLDEKTFQENEWQILRENYRADKIVSAKIRLELVGKNSDYREGSLCVFVRQGDVQKKYNSFYVRNGMTITKINSSASGKGVEALVLIDKGPLTDFLGDAEGASHEDWAKSGMERIEKNWKKRGSGIRIEFCRQIVDKFVEQLNPPTEKTDYDLLSDYFYKENSSKSNNRADNIKSSPNNAFPNITSKPKWFNIYAEAGGFKLTRIKDIPIPKNAKLRISIAYDIPNGNPIKKWSPFDFCFDEGMTEIGQYSGIEILSQKKNIIEIAVIQDLFYLENKNFDPYRDLFVRVEEIT